MLVAARTHDYGKQPIDSLAGLLKSEGIDAAQLVLPKGFTEISSYDEVTPEIIERIRANFEKEGIKIHILGCYMDLGNPDDDVRKNAVDTFKKCLAFNKTLGASIVGSETAYPHLNDEEKKVWHPYMMDSIARLVEERFPKLNGRVEINYVGTTIGSHTGPGTVALFFWGKSRKGS